MSKRRNDWAEPRLPERDYISVDAWRHSRPPHALRWSSTTARPALRLVLDASLEVDEAEALCDRALDALYGVEDDGGK